MDLSSLFPSVCCPGCVFSRLLCVRLTVCLQGSGSAGEAESRLSLAHAAPPGHTNVSPRRQEAANGV